MSQAYLKKIKGRYLTAKFRFFKKVWDKKVKILDVGCGSKSPSLTKNVFTNCIYHGIDRHLYHNTEHDIACANKFFEANLDENPDMPFLEDQLYDVIIFSHVIEHLVHGDRVLAVACKHLAEDGVIYVEYPGPKSLSLPSMKGTMNFSDDPTHVRLFDIKEVANIMLSNNVTVVKGGTRRFWPSYILLIPRLFKIVFCRVSPAGALWDMYGMAEYVLGIKKQK